VLEFDHFNELHTVSRRLIEAATDSRELSLAGEQRSVRCPTCSTGRAGLRSRTRTS